MLVHNGCKEYSDWETFKKDNKGKRGDGGIGGYLKNNKPKHSPDVKKWFKNNGTIEINGSEWTYKKVLSDGQIHYATYTAEGNITFSPNSFYPDTHYASVDIGQFTGSRSGDMNAYLNELLINELPENYELHHHYENGILQLIDKEAHKTFTHRGGYSIHK